MIGNGLKAHNCLRATKCLLLFFFTMKIQYQIPLLLNLGETIDEVGDLMNKINATLSKRGIEENIRAEGEIGTLSLSVNRELNKGEKDKMKDALQSSIKSILPQYNIRVGELRRKSGNVEQSDS